MVKKIRIEPKSKLKINHHQKRELKVMKMKGMSFIDFESYLIEEGYPKEEVEALLIDNGYNVSALKAMESGLPIAKILGLLFVALGLGLPLYAYIAKGQSSLWLIILGLFFIAKGSVLIIKKPTTSGMKTKI